MQKLLKYISYKFRNKDIIEKFYDIKNLPYLNKAENDKRLLLKLNELLNYAYDNVSYYRSLLETCGIVSNGIIQLNSIDEFQKIPFLTKQIITQQKENIYSKKISNRRSYKNTSGGSTGEPVVFMQDREFKVNNEANFYIVESWRGAGIYDSRLLLWGAERDTFKGKKPFSSYVREYITNRMILNSFSMSDQDMKHYIKIINNRKPKLIIAYVQSIYELAKFAKKNNIKINKQNAIHSAAGTLYEFMRDEIEKVFGCKVYNHYGSREVGPIASECKEQNGLHIIMDHTYVEVVDENGNLCQPEEEGEIVVTTLNNFSMPLIRYKIGDIGIMQKYTSCNCGCTYPKLEKVTGRTTDLFTSMVGKKIDGEYFTHLFYFVEGIKVFQVIQEELDKIVVKIVSDNPIKKDALLNIKSKIQFVMGKDCHVAFEFVDNIPKTTTGKYLYTISKI